jgi:hypothetical protein
MQLVHRITAALVAAVVVIFALGVIAGAIAFGRWPGDDPSPPVSTVYDECADPINLPENHGMPGHDHDAMLRCFGPDGTMAMGEGS